MYGIAVDEIVGVSPWNVTLSRRANTFATLILGNRTFGRAIVIERRRHVPRYVIVTPDDPDLTLAALRGRFPGLAAQTGRLDRT